MSTEATTNFLGIPVDGTIQSTSRTEQKPLSDLEPFLRAVLDDERIVSFGWQQYTPYFNDGDACVFGISEPWFRTVDDDEDVDRYALEIDGHASLGARFWDGKASRYVNVDRDAETVACRERCLDLAHAIGSSAFNDVLLAAFGDHAEVELTRDGITVDTYSHE